jgi:LysR family hydrogen peroxide-inducible transcriptional activator
MWRFIFYHCSKPVPRLEILYSYDIIIIILYKSVATARKGSVMQNRDLEYVLAIYETQSFSKAAEKLMISQPSLSQYIKRLEKQLGLQLFYRNRSEVTLTPGGRIYISYAKQILGSMAEMEKALAQYKREQTQSLTIGFSHSYGRYILPPLVHILKELFPQRKVKFVDGLSTLMEKEILDSNLTLGVFAGPLLYHELTFLPVLTEHFCFAVSQDNKEAMALLPKAWNGKTLDLSCFKNFPFVLHIHGKKMNDMMNQICLAYHFRPEVMCEAETMDTLYALVKDNCGVSLLPSTLIAGIEENKNNVLFFPLQENTSTREIGLVYRDDSFTRATARHLGNALKKELSGLTASYRQRLERQERLLESYLKK